MNATLQCLKVVPELREALTRYNVPATPSELMSADNGSPQALTRGEGVNVYFMLPCVYQAVDTDAPNCLICTYMYIQHRHSPEVKGLMSIPHDCHMTVTCRSEDAVSTNGVGSQYPDPITTVPAHSPRCGA